MESRCLHQLPQASVVDINGTTDPWHTERLAVFVFLSAIMFSKILF